MQLRRLEVIYRRSTFVSLVQDDIATLKAELHDIRKQMKVTHAKKDGDNQTRAGTAIVP